MSTAIAKAAPGAIRRPVKRLFREAGVATSRWRPLPDYLIIGAHRTGSTSLWAYLSQHPSVGVNFPRLEEVKGVRYFDENYHQGDDWYRSHFPTTAYRRYLERRHGPRAVAGDASTYYIFHPRAAERAARLVPDAKIIVLLRNPVDRAYSHWRRDRRDGREPLERFEDAIAAEPERIAGEAERIMSDDGYYSAAHENQSYLTQSLYLEPLRQWLAYYSRERVHIELSEQFFADPQRAYERVLGFLGLPAITLRDASPQNTTEGDAMDPVTRAELSARVAPHNEQLAEFLGIELGWDGA